MDKRGTVIESIQKLVALGVSDREIAENLYDVGIERTEAVSLIDEAKKDLPQSSQTSTNTAQNNSQSSSQTQAVSSNQTSSSQQVLSQNQKSKEPIFDEAQGLSMDEQVVRQLPIDKKNISEGDSAGASDSIEEGASDSDELENEAKDLGSGFDEKILGGEDDQEPDIIKDEPKIATKKQSQTQGFASSGNQSGSSFLAQSFSASADGLNIRQTSPKMNYAKQGLAQSVSVSKGSFSNQTTQSLQPKSLGGHGGIMESNTEWEELWKKGIVTAVNAKLAEIKIIKESIDSELGQKVDEAVRKELYQFKVLMDSQKDLLISTNKEALEDKQKEIAFIIDSKIAELRQYNKQLGDNLAVIDASKRQQEYALSQISLALDEARKTKSQLVIEVNSEMIKSKSGAQAFLDSASNQLAQMDERISKTLELEKNIAEGMLVAAEQKIETLTIQRADELIGALQVELNKLQAVSKSVSPEVLEQKIAVLEEFKKQFLNSMQENLTQINSAIIDLNNRNAAAEKALAEKSLAIDAKLEELTKFEKNFVSLLDKAVNKK